MAQKPVPASRLSSQTPRLLLDGHSLADVVEYVQQQEPGINAETVAEWCFAYFRSAAEVPKDARLGWLIESHRELYRKMVEIADFAGATRSLVEIAKLTKELSQAEEQRATKTKSTPKKTEQVPWIHLDELNALSSAARNSRN